MPYALPIEVQDPGDFILPAGLVPITTLRVLRNQEGQPDELIFVLDRKLRPLLRGHKKLMLSLRGTQKQIEIDAKACAAPCSDQEPAKLGLRHLHLTMLPIPLMEIIREVIRAL
jgi:hypothetical protein